MPVFFFFQCYTRTVLLDSDEPLLSGSGAVSKEVDAEILEQWRKMVEAWKATPERFLFTKKVCTHLIRKY